MSQVIDAQSYQEYVVAQRRYYHAHPELSTQEVQTTARIAAELQGMGLEVKFFDGIQGCYADIIGAKPGKTVLLRADIDALPVTEKTTVDFASQNTGVMHACGHDTHIAMQLTAAKMLCDRKADLCGRVRLFFQPAEEQATGCLQAMEQGVIDNVDACYSMHVLSQIDAPLFNFEDGYRMASADQFKLTVRGLSSHGSQPHLGKDAMVTAAEIIMASQTIVSRQNNAFNPAVLTYGTMQGGQRFNIIANEVVLEGTIRTFDKEFHAQIPKSFEKLATSIAEAHGCTATLECKNVTPCICNDAPELVRIANQAVTKLYGAEGLTEAPMTTISEDFAFMMEKVPGVHGFLGARSCNTPGSEKSNHNDCFLADESCLIRGAAVAAQFALDFLAQ